MSEPIPNIPLLRKAVEWVEAQDALPEHERQWLQAMYVLPAEAPGTWLARLRATYNRPASCGTCYCVAGKIQHDLTGSENEVTARRVAMEALGLTDDQAFALFAGGNTAADVRRIAEDIAGERL